MASSVISSPSVILTTAMAVSGAFIFLSLCRTKNLPITHHNSDSPLRSCLSSDDKRREKKKKKVKFADNVKDQKNEFTTMISKKKKKKIQIYEGEKLNPENHQMPANRAALYHGILRDRVHRIECSY
ncbi:unnamed protein product [Amaranthus hypochondriacus]